MTIPCKKYIKKEDRVCGESYGWKIETGEHEKHGIELWLCNVCTLKLIERKIKEAKTK